ncbi:T9SS type A sorting domain-containing protein [Candidatus Zixiibacteriota bacterium]
MNNQRNLTTMSRILLRLAVFALVFAPVGCLADAGDLDLTFGDGGKVITNFMGPNDDYGRDAVAVQVDGKIVVVGESRGIGDLDFDFAVARYHSDGTLDIGFSGDGMITTDFASGYDVANAVVIQADGKILAVGPADSDGATGYDFGLVRYTRDGTLDAKFGSGGMVTTDFNSSSDMADGVDIQADGKIVVAGQTHYSKSPTGVDFALARYEGIGASPPELLALLVGEIQELVTTEDLNNGQGNALLVKLQAAIQQLDRDNFGAAVNQLQAFINQVQALMNAEILSPEEGLSLIATAQDAIDGLAKPAGELALENGAPSRYRLFQNYPNPFNAQTTIEYALTEAAEVTVDVYDLLGRRVAVLIDEHRSAGYHSINWDATAVSSGTYFYRIQAGRNIETRKMVLLK